MLTFVFWALLAIGWYLMLCKPFRHARTVAGVLFFLALGIWLGRL